MKGFIEVTLTESCEIIAIKTSKITRFTFRRIWLNDGSACIGVKESYEEIKQLIKDSQ